MEVSKLDTEYLLTVDQAKQIHDRIDQIAGYQKLYWTVLD
jgi:hypothetical protein